MEEWRAIPGLPQYEASSEGRIRHVKRKVLRPFAPRRKDYPRINVQVGYYKQRKVHVHVLVARAFIGECPAGYEHNHKDGNKHNARPENLEFVTRSENLRHKFKVLGQVVNQGSQHGMAKLTETQVVAIRSEHAAGASQQALAERYHVCVGSLSLIVNRKTWRHI